MKSTRHRILCLQLFRRGKRAAVRHRRIRGQLWETLAADVQAQGAKLQFGHSVKRIVCEGGRVKAVVCDTPQGEQTLEGDIFISSMPVKDLVLGMEAAAPARIRELAAGLPYRDFVTVGLLVPRLGLKNETAMKTLGNIVPDCWIYVQDPRVKLGRIQIFNNWSPYMVKDPRRCWKRTAKPRCAGAPWCTCFVRTPWARWIATTKPANIRCPCRRQAAV